MSTESEGPDDAVLNSPAQGGPMPEELKATIERPIDDDELNHISHNLSSIVRPDHVYYSEAKREYFWLDRCRRGPKPEMFRGLNGVRRWVSSFFITSSVAGRNSASGTLSGVLPDAKCNRTTISASGHGDGSPVGRRTTRCTRTIMHVNSLHAPCACARSCHPASMLSRSWTRYNCWPS